MKCLQHVDIDAVGTCHACGAGVCVACFRRYVPALCVQDALAQSATVRGSIRRGLWIAGALAILGFVWGALSGGPVAR